MCVCVPIARTDEIVKSDIWYHFKEGFNNAVRRNITMADLLWSQEMRSVQAAVTSTQLERTCLIASRQHVPRCSFHIVLIQITPILFMLMNLRLSLICTVYVDSRVVLRVICASFFRDRTSWFPNTELYETNRPLQCTEWSFQFITVLVLQAYFVTLIYVRE